MQRAQVALTAESKRIKELLLIVPPLLRPTGSMRAKQTGGPRSGKRHCLMGRQQGLVC
jgi:hypothetical protein